MGLVALSVGPDVTFVLAYHFFRLFSILLVVLHGLLNRRFEAAVQGFTSLTGKSGQRRFSEGGTNIK
jgi:hypothetical protein